MISRESKRRPNHWWLNYIFSQLLNETSFLFLWRNFVSFLIFSKKLIVDVGCSWEDKFESKWSWWYSNWHSFGSWLCESLWMQDGCFLCWLPWYYITFYLPVLLASIERVSVSLLVLTQTWSALPIAQSLKPW